MVVNVMVNEWSPIITWALSSFWVERRFVTQLAPTMRTDQVEWSLTGGEKL